MGVLVASSLSLSAFLGWAWISDRSSRRQWKKSLRGSQGRISTSVWR